MGLSLALRLLPVWGWIKRLVAAYPWQIAFALVLAWGAWERSGKLKALDQRNQCFSASQAAAEATKAQRDAERRDYQEKANHADQEHKAALAAARSDTERYIAAHRVRPGRNLGAPGPVSQAEDTREPEAVPASSFVAVSDADVQACTAAAAYAVTARDYLLSIGE